MKLKRTLPRLTKSLGLVSGSLSPRQFRHRSIGKALKVLKQELQKPRSLALIQLSDPDRRSTDSHTRATPGSDQGALMTSILRTERKLLSEYMPALSPLLDASQPARMSSPLDDPVTFGVELEFIIRVKDGPYGHLREIPISQDPEWGAEACIEKGNLWSLPERHVAVLLRKHGFKAISNTEKIWLPFDTEAGAKLRERFPTKYPRDNRRTAYTDYYKVDTDGSIRLGYDQHVRISDQDAGIEIITPALPFNPESLKEITEVIELIAKNFTVTVNTTCGLHVHVGNGDKGFDLEWLRSIATLLWSSSSLIDLLHPSHRGPANAFMYGLHHFSYLAHQHEILLYERPDGPVLWSIPQQVFAEDDNPRYLLRQAALFDTWVDDPALVWCGVQRLAAARTAREIVHLLCYVLPGNSLKRLAYNFKNLRRQDDDRGDNPRTIEFRQHEGTIDPKAICAWVNLVCKMVAVCRSDPQLVERIARKAAHAHLELGTYDALGILLDLGCTDEAKYYYERLRKAYRERVVLSEMR